MRDVHAEATEGAPRVPRQRGAQWTYWHDCINHCPACGKTSWHIGRFSAECSFCTTALALEHSAMLGCGTFCRNQPARN